MNKDEELELLLEVYREQPLPNTDDKTLKELTDMVEVRNVNFSVEQKLDKIIELLEKLTNTTVINAPIAERSEHSSSRTVKSEKGKDFLVDPEVTKYITEALSKLTKKLEGRTTVKEPGKEEFIQIVKEIDWSSILEPKIKIACKDEKGEIFTLEEELYKKMEV